MAHNRIPVVDEVTVLSPVEVTVLSPVEVTGADLNVEIGRPADGSV